MRRKNERIPFSESLFDPFFLYSLNRSAIAAQRRNNLAINKDEGNIWLLRTCSDARVHCVLDPTRIAVFSSIAAAGPKMFSSAYTHKAYDAVLNYTHFDGASFQDGCTPGGCGGLHERQKMMVAMEHGQFVRPIEGAAAYVYEELQVADPLHQAFIDSVAIVHMMQNKPVFFGSLDHSSSVLHIAGVVHSQRGEVRYLSPVDFQQYDSCRVYSKGFPEMHPDWLRERGEGLLAQQLEEVLKDNQRQVDRLHRLNANHQSAQKVQNPPMIYVTTLPHSLRVLFPGIAELPNTDFALRFPKIKRGESEVVALMKPGLQQLQYPIVHCTQAREIGKGPFRDSLHMFVTAERLSLAAEIAQQIILQPYMKPWIDNGGKIIVAGLTKGVIPSKNDIRVFKP